jgi:hypothetical protein
LLGIGEFNFWPFKVYTAALYGPLEADSPEEILSEVPKVLIIHYHRSLKPRDFILSGRKALVNNPENDLRAISGSLEQINMSYRKVNKGDRYAILYRPQSGFKLFLNDTLLGEFKNEEFAEAYFGIWLSEYSIDEDLTDSLLNRKSVY